MKEEKGYKIINPLKMDKKKYLVLLYDIFFWLSLIGLSGIYGFFELKLIKNKVTILDISSVMQGYGINQAYDMLLSFYIYSIIYTVLFLLSLSLARSFFRILSTSLIFKEKLPNKKQFFNYYLVNLIFMLPLTILIIFFLYNYINPEYGTPAFSLLGFYLSLIVILLFSRYAMFYTINFIKTKRAFISVKKGFIDSFNFKLFGMPYLLLLLLFAIITFIIWLIPKSGIFFIIGYFISFLWVREYIGVCYGK